MFDKIELYYYKLMFTLDKIFLLPYKLFYFIFKNGILAYFLGTFVLSFLAILVGKLLLGFIFYINRNYIKTLNEELVKWYNLSVEALERGDSERFHLFNKEANEYFGKLFFLNISHTVSLLIPLPFLLFWLQLRFGKVEFPLPFFEYKVNYFFTFVVCYFLAWIFYKLIYRYLPVYKKIEEFVAICGDVQKEMKSMAEVLKEKLKGQTKENHINKV
jgi:hypothetical protein